jgi:type II secretory pathway predicted ATPase ExeA
VSSFLDHFGLKEPPFSKEIGDKDLWLPSSKATIVDELIEALEGRSSVLLTGDPGTGKTCVLRALRHRLPREGFRLTYCHNATLGRRDFYRQLCLVLGLSTSSTAAAVFYAVSKHVEDLGKEKVHPVFLLDEAHLLHQDMVDHLHILLNYEWDRRPLLSLVLVGLPDLEERLSKRRNRSLCSRIAQRLRIDPLVPDDTAEYIAHRLKLVGFNKDVFADESITLLHEHTGGAMRDIDRIALAAMRLTAKRKRKLIERDVVAHVIEAENRHAA